jgi:hypothetical protein
LPVVLVVLLAFLTASFPASNSDLWFHLATGRLLAGGELSPGADPFAYTAEDYWPPATWLFDLGLYALYGWLGGAGVVVLKALLVAALAGLLLSIRRSTNEVGAAVVCTALAILAMRPRLLLQPACVSYFLLGLTLWLLYRMGKEKPGPAEGAPVSAARGAWASSPVLLLLVFAVWVNVDAWFLLGPLLAGLFWLGERLNGERRAPLWVVPAGLAVCLLNPHTFRAFALPPEMSAVTWNSGLRRDVRFQPLFASPWQSTYLRAAVELNAAALAYFVLTALGLVSFLLVPRSLRNGRLVVWLPFAALAAWQARAIPFFAVVAAPLTTLNLQDWLAQRRKDEGGRMRRPFWFILHPSSFILPLGLVALIGLTWAGWLAGRGQEGRPIGWGAPADPSLWRVAEELHRWRRAGLVGEDERVFVVSPEVAHYGAWFCPGERHFFDHRYPLFPSAARHYEEVCRGLLPATADISGPREEAPDWRRVLRDHKVGIVVLYDRDPQRLFAMLRRLARAPEEWTMLDVAGQAVIFGWNQARPAGGWRPLAFDADQRAFGPQEDREIAAVPSEGPELLPARRPLWARRLRPTPPPSWEASAATVYLRYFHDSETGQRSQELRSSLSACAASLAGLPAQRAGASLVALQMVASRHLLQPRDGTSSFLGREQLGPYFQHLVERSPALPLLAVGAARRALAANPEDSRAWLRLGEAYVVLRDRTCERSSEGLMPPLAQLRNIQIVTALEQAVRLDPGLEAAHHELSYLYGERNALDKALEHRQAEAHLSRRAGRRPGETTEEWAHRVELIDRDVSKLEDEIQKRRDLYASSSPALQGERVAQAQMALKLGLARQATEELLLPTPVNLLGPAGIKLELELLLSLGRADDVRTILRDKEVSARKALLPYHDVPAPRKADGTALYPIPYHWPGYEWLNVLQSSAVGDYDQAR